LLFLGLEIGITVRYNRTCKKGLRKSGESINVISKKHFYNTGNIITWTIASVTYSWFLKGGSFIKEEQYTSKQGADPIKIEKNIIGQPFPKVTSKSLAGKVVTLPETAKGKVTLIYIAFVRSAQSMIDSWAQPLELEFGKDSRFAIYEVPMINAAWKVLSWMIDSGMRGGIPVEKHDNVVTFYGDYSDYQEALGMEDTNFAYVFLLDQKGIIRWKGHGYASPEAEKELVETAKTLI
jgi:hypothetical protein